MRSTRHTRKALGLGPVLQVWECTVCSAEFTRSDSFRLHLTTAKHRRNTQRRLACQRRPSSSLTTRVGEWV